MSKSKCQTIQLELDELMIGESCPANVLSHLNECSDCREFNEKQTKLRQIVGSLGTVSAPPDFDFRLRSRLARENGVGSYANRTGWLFGQRTAAAMLMLLLLVGAAFGVRYFINRGSDVVISKKADPATPQPTQTREPIQESSPTQPAEVVTAGSNPQIANVPVNVERPRTERTVKRDSKRPLSTVEYSGSTAPVVGRDRIPATEATFPIDASQQSLKVSLFDSKGNARTVSVPAVSFGSQRAVPNGNQLAPKGIW